METLKPPRPGETIEQPFPPAEPVAGGPAPATGPLVVLRTSPMGPVPLAPFLSVTFSQPMVALGTVAQMAAQTVPVQLTPQPDGAWRWVGTQTLLFEPTTRFPMATEYHVVVPAETKSALGGVLSQAADWYFTTPAVELVSSYPDGGPTVREPVMFAAFNQRVDQGAVLETVTLSAGGRTYGVRPASEAEVQADEAVRLRASAAGEGRWVAFKPVEALPPATTVTVNIGPDTPSAEGPLLTTAVQSFTFTTYGPMLVEALRCGWNDECPPMSPWSLDFTNPLDEQAFDPASITISPELPDLTVSASYDTVSLRGRSAGRTTYKVTVRAGVKDIFGQSLEKDVTLTVKVGSAYPSFNVPGGNFVVLDPAAKPGISLYSVNYGAAQVRAYAVQPTDWPAYQQYLRDASRDATKDLPPGKQVLDQRVTLRGEADALSETVIDLSKLKAQGHRHLIMVIQPEVGVVARARGQYPPIYRLWVQMSDLAVDALLDSEELVAWATSLSTGAALADVALAALSRRRQSAQTDHDGLARLPLAASQRPSKTRAISWPPRRRHRAACQNRAWSWGTRLDQTALDSPFRWYVWDDRQMYRPGEEVHVKGWARYVRVERGDDHLELPGAGSVTWELHRQPGQPRRRRLGRPERPGRL